jgi:hypothetical protein
MHDISVSIRIMPTLRAGVVLLIFLVFGRPVKFYNGRNGRLTASLAGTANSGKANGVSLGRGVLFYHHQFSLFLFFVAGGSTGYQRIFLFARLERRAFDLLERSSFFCSFCLSVLYT